MESELICFDLDSDPTKLVDGMIKSFRAMLKAHGASEDLTKEFEKLARGADKVGTKVEEASANLGDLAAGADTVAPALGSAIRFVDDFSKGAAELSNVVGPAGLTGLIGVGLVVALGVGATALYQLGTAAAEAGERLEGTGLLTAEQEELVDDLKASTDAAALAQDLFTVRLAESLPIVRDLNTAYTGLQISAADYIATIDKVGDEHDEVSTGVGLLAKQFPVLALAWNATIDAWSEKGEEFVETQAAMTESLEEEERRRASATAGAGQVIKQELEDRKQREKDLTEALKRRAAAEKEAAALAAAAAKAQRDANEDVVESYRKVRDAHLAAEVAKLDAWNKTLTEELRSLDAFIDQAIAKNQQETEAIEAEQQERRDQIKAGVEEGVSGTLEAIADISRARAEARLEEIDADKEQSRSRLDALEEQLANGRLLSQQQRAAIEQKIADERKLQKTLTDERKKAANQAKAAAIGQALIGASLAIIQCFAQLGPIGGAIAAVPVGIATGAEIAAIQKQQFHDGGLMGLGHGPDEFFAGGGATARRGEAQVVLNQRAVERGGVQQVDAINRGVAGPSGDRAGVMVLDGRVVGEIVVREQRRPGSPLAAGSPDGVSNPFRRVR